MPDAEQQATVREDDEVNRLARRLNESESQRSLSRWMTAALTVLASIVSWIGGQSIEHEITPELMTLGTGGATIVVIIICLGYNSADRKEWLKEVRAGRKEHAQLVRELAVIVNRNSEGYGRVMIFCDHVLRYMEQIRPGRRRPTAQGQVETADHPPPT